MFQAVQPELEQLSDSGEVVAQVLLAEMYALGDAAGVVKEVSHPSHARAVQFSSVQFSCALGYRERLEPVRFVTTALSLARRSRLFVVVLAL